MQVMRLYRSRRGCASSRSRRLDPPPPSRALPEPSKPVDPHRYIGRWYEIARLPNMLQKDCVEPTSEWTSFGGDEVDAVVECLAKGGGGRRGGTPAETAESVKLVFNTAIGHVCNSLVSQDTRAAS